jgi:transcriptional regulator of arginine metabolism
MSTLHRRHLLLEILTSGGAASQHELVEALADHGIEVTQTTVSRDLAAIGAVKSSAGYSIHAPATGAMSVDAADEGAFGALRTHALSVAQADSLVVIKTVPGHAAIVGDALDAAQDDAIVGTIAGENTVFVATPSKAAASRLTKRWSAALTGKEAA